MGRNWDPRANPVGVKQRVCAGIPVSIYLSQKKLGAQDGTQNWASKFQKEPSKSLSSVGEINGIQS